MSMLQAAIEAALVDAEYCHHRDAAMRCWREWERTDERRERIAALVHEDQMRRCFARILRRLSGGDN